MTNVLVYAQDTGGAQNVAIVAKRVLQTAGLNISIIVHPSAKASFDTIGVPCILITDIGFNPPLNQLRAREFLDTVGCDYVFCGTSSQWQDPSNSNIIQSAKEHDIPCFAFMDHWKGWDRFFDQDNRLAYVPELLGCIDEYSIEKLEQIGIPKDNIVVTGHPYLEQIYRYAQSGAFNSLKQSRKRIILVSQPMVERNFGSIFSVQLGDTSLVEIIDKILDNLRNIFDFEVYYRPHPKEDLFASLPDSIARDSPQLWTAALKNTDIIIGLDSMALIEAFVAGKTCISLKLPELGNVTDVFCPLEFARSVFDLNQLEKVLADALEDTTSFFPEVDAFRSIVDGATERTTETLLDFIGAHNKPRVPD